MGGAAATQLTIGARLKAARSAKRMTLDELAAASGVTKGYLSKVERGQASASVSALMRICEELDLHVGALFEATPVGEVVRADEYPQIEFGGEKMREYQLTPGSERRMQVLLSDIEPGGGSGIDTYSLPSEVEFVTVIEGCIHIDFVEGDGTRITLNKGDALTFAADRPHAFHADTATGATVLWVLIPALSNRPLADPSPQ
ncbi:MAG: XRE family transcriptional regulator [Mycobacterium sp.]